MRFVLAVVLLVAALVAGSVAYLAASPAGSPVHRRLDGEAEELLALVPSEGAREDLRERSEALAGRIERAIDRHHAARRVHAGPALRAGAVRACLGAAALPILLALLGIGAIAGLLRRDVLAAEFGFASVTFSYFGKALVAISVALYSFTALSPMGPPVWTLYLSMLAAAGGTAMYFGNLPPKI